METNNNNLEQEEPWIVLEKSLNSKNREFLRMKASKEHVPGHGYIKTKAKLITHMILWKTILQDDDPSSFLYYKKYTIEQLRSFADHFKLEVGKTSNLLLLQKQVLDAVQPLFERKKAAIPSKKDVMENWDQPRLYNFAKRRSIPGITPSTSMKDLQAAVCGHIKGRVDCMNKTELKAYQKLIESLFPKPNQTLKSYHGDLKKLGIPGRTNIITNRSNKIINSRSSIITSKGHGLTKGEQQEILVDAIYKHISQQPQDLDKLDEQGLLRIIFGKHIPYSSAKDITREQLTSRIKEFVQNQVENRQQLMQLVKEGKEGDSSNSSILSNLAEFSRYMGTSQKVKWINQGEVSKHSSYKKDLEEIFGANSSFREFLRLYFKTHGSCTALINLTPVFKHIKDDSEGKANFTKHREPLSSLEQVEQWIDALPTFFATKIEEHEGRGSDLVYHRMEELVLRMAKYSPSTAGGFIPLPKSLSQTGGYINIQNTDQECFKYCFVAGCGLAQASFHEERQELYTPYFSMFKWDALSFPTELEDLGAYKQFEEDNPEAPPLNIHLLESMTHKTPVPYYTSIKKGFNKNYAVNLLFFARDKEPGKGHFCWMKNPTRALSSLTKQHAKRSFCMRCYQTFPPEDPMLLEKHSEQCIPNYIPQVVKLPEPCKLHASQGKFGEKCGSCWFKKTCFFKNTENKQRLPLVLMVDFEALNQKPDRKNADKTKYLARQDALSYGITYQLDPKYSHLFPSLEENGYEEYVQESEDMPSPSEHFVKRVIEIGRGYFDVVQNTNIPIDDSTIPTFVPDKTECHICERLIKEKQEVCPEDLAEMKKLAMEIHGDDDVEEDVEEEMDANLRLAELKRKIDKIQRWNPVRDHDHLTGEFRGWAHDMCNRKYTLKFKPLSIGLHNFKGYDCKHIIAGLVKAKHTDLSCIMESGEKAKTLTIKDDYEVDVEDPVTGKMKTKKIYRRYRFVDTLAHLPKSLEELVYVLVGYTDDHKDKGISFEEFVKSQDCRLLRSSFPAVSKHFPQDEDFKMVLRKGVFPYDWMDSLDKLQHVEPLEKKDFYSTLSGEEISEKDYQHYRKVYDSLLLPPTKNFKAYHDLYLKLDCLLLSDVCLDYRNKILGLYKLDPFHYITSPSLAWDAALKNTKVKLQLLDDITMYNTIKKGIRGGVSYIGKRYTEEGDECEEDNVAIIYIDANNLYGLAMSQELPIGDYGWESQEKLAEFNKELQQSLFKPVHPDPSVGRIYVVDMKYPKHLHDLHNDYPLAPESIVPPTEDTEGKEKNHPKLIPHLGPRKEYVVLDKMLQFYIEQGMDVSKIHSCISFTQKAWMKPFIELNTGQRAKAKTAFEKDLWKLMNNQTFGQTIMDPINFGSFELVNSSHHYKNIQRLPMRVKSESWEFCCNSCKELPFENNGCTPDESCLVGMERYKREATINRPTTNGFVILELAKLHMYKFWYEKLMATFGQDRLRLVMTDTDSFIFELSGCKDGDYIQELSDKLGQYFDFSNLPKEHACYNTDNKKVVGKMKLETGASRITDFVGLCSKCYCYKTVDQDGEEVENKAAKGVKKKVKKRELCYEDYLMTLYLDNVLPIKQVLLSSKSMRMYLMEQEKTALKPTDTKRCWVGGSTEKPLSKNWGNTLAWGHYRLQQQHCIARYNRHLHQP